MKAIILTLLTLVSLSVFADTEYPRYPTVNYGSGEKAKQIKRGEYLVKAGDCIACHTAKGGTAFAGGYAISTPFGKIYGPNITSSKKYGIGAWSDAEFIKTMREGINPKGEYLYPAFPYLFFNRLTDDDLIAIKAYLDATPAIDQPSTENEMMWPFNWRFLQIGWRALFFYPEKQGVFVPDPNQSAQWNRGAYLVQGLGHCGMCHTPSYYIFSKKYPLAAPVKKYFLSGNMVEGYFAPNITSTLMKDATDQQLMDVFRKDEHIEGGKIQGPMLEANHDSLKYLTDEDVRSIAAYLRTVVSQSPPKVSRSGLEGGKATYEQYCTGCHTNGAGGAPKLGDAAAWEPIIKLGIDTVYSNAINGIGAMPAKGTCSTCTDQEIKDAVDYMVSVDESGSGSSASSVPAPKPLTMEQGKELYNKYCSVCHNPNSNYPNAPIIGDKQAWKGIIQQGMDEVFYNTLHGFGNMPARGGCPNCNGAEIKAAVKYMVQESSTEGDYRLW